MIHIDGSSPRVRGTLVDGFRGEIRSVPVHPRVCGEHNQGQADTDGRLQIGSSPRVRGTRPLALCYDPPRGLRFIPACAGNTTAVGFWHRRFGRTVHPRVCGEHKRQDILDQRRWRTVHPRVCGEHRYALASKPFEPRILFIPACAGNTPTEKEPVGYPSLNTVHPRVCGEHAHTDLGVCRAFSVNGSSPRVRGTRPGLLPRAPSSRRFIPACAGNAQTFLLQSSATNRFIPACAGNTPGIVTFGHIFTTDGSSPRVRGTPRRFAPSAGE